MRTTQIKKPDPKYQTMSNTRLFQYSISTLAFLRNALHVPSPSLPLAACGDGAAAVRKLPCRRYYRHGRQKKFVSFVLAESGSPKSPGEDETLSLLRELADSFLLPSDFFQQLPRDLRLDLNDAAFDLANGPVTQECGEELGQMLLNLSKAWEQADSSTSGSIVSNFPLLGETLSDSVKAAFGKRLAAAGRRFQAMGQYGDGELQRIAKIMLKTGKLLSAGAVITAEKKPRTETRMFKFGDLQVAVTPEKANIGAAIGFAFGLLSWGLSRGIESVPESSLQYANDNALLLAKSLRGALLVMCYSATLLCAFATLGLILLGRELSSEKSSE